MGLTVLLGGARSGKSTLALRRATSAEAPVVFVATAEAGDHEMAERIARHRSERPAHWTTVEEPLALSRALGDAAPHECVVVDCLSLWVANLLGRGETEDGVLAAASEAAALAAGRPGATIAVSNEVGMGIVPGYPSGRAYRDVLGRVNATWVGAAADAALVVAGRLLPLIEEGDR